jgi:hypothetical protein
MSKKYDVGQVLYVISKKERKVYPVLVIEEIVRKTLSGAETSYIVQLPDRKATTFPLEAVTDHPFTSAAEIRDHLVRTASDSISAMVMEAETLAQVLRPSAAEAAASLPVEHLEEDETVLVDLPDGTKARLRVS